MNALLAGGMAASLAATLVLTVPVAARAEGIFIPGVSARVHGVAPGHDRGRHHRDRFHDDRFDDRPGGTSTSLPIQVQPQAFPIRIAPESARARRVRSDRDFDREDKRHRDFFRDRGRHERDRWHDDRFDDLPGGSLTPFAIEVQPQAFPTGIAREPARIHEDRSDRDFDGRDRRQSLGGHRDFFKDRGRHHRDRRHDDRFDKRRDATSTSLPIQVDPQALPTGIAGESARVRAARSDRDFDGRGKRPSLGGQRDRFDRNFGRDRASGRHDRDRVDDDRKRPSTSTALSMTVRPNGLSIAAGSAK